MHTQGLIRVIAVDEQPLFQYAIQKQLENAPGFEIAALGNSPDEIEPLIRQYQPHIAILDGCYHLVAEPVSMIEILQCLHLACPDTKILILSSELDRTLTAILESCNIRGYLLKCDPLTHDLPNIVRLIHLGGRLYSEAIQQILKTPPSGNDYLTTRQCEVLLAVIAAPNLSYKQHAARLNISESTWDSHLRNIYTRLEVNSLTAAVLRAASLGIINLA